MSLAISTRGVGCGNAVFGLLADPVEGFLQFDGESLPWPSFGSTGVRHHGLAAMSEVREVAQDHRFAGPAYVGKA